MLKDKRKVILTIIAILLVLLIFLGLTYAFMKPVTEGNKYTNMEVKSCAKVLFTDTASSVINMTNAYPMSDPAGLNTDPYTFSISKTCEGNVSVRIYLVSVSGNTIPDSKIKYAITAKGTKNILTRGMLNKAQDGEEDYTANEKTELKTSMSITNYSKIYKVYSAQIPATGALEYDLYLWIDSSADNTYMNKTFSLGVAVKTGEVFELRDTYFYASIANSRISTYDANVNCENSNQSKWNPMSRRLEVFNVSDVPVNCELSDKTNTNSGNLKTIVESNGIHETGYGNYSTIAQSGYSLITPAFYTTSWSTSVTSGTEESTALSWDGNNSYWVTNPTQTNMYYYYLFNVTSEGYYQVCYKKISGGTSDRLYRYKNTSSTDGSSYITASSTTDICYSLGNVTTTDTIRISQYTSSTVASLGIYIKKSTSTVDAGYRYEGGTPNNYIWFNNEMWRIIGSIPTKIDSSTTSNLVKIIRNTSIGGLVWHTVNPRPNWNVSSLYTLLNSYYYSKQNGTNTSYCYENTNVKSKCDYRQIGISNDSNDYYGSMIKNVYWNTGISNSYTSPVGTVYGTEIDVQDYQGYIGLMSASDYGYASNYSRGSISGYANANYTGSDWLYTNGYEWTITPFAGSTNNSLHIAISGYVTNSSINYGFAVRPVVYLDSSVYVVSGDGTEANPYKIAK